jgi:ABC-type nitrate/sulfonate/bicarbonate transport system substrate-binding protein
MRTSTFYIKSSFKSEGAVEKSSVSYATNASARLPLASTVYYKFKTVRIFVFSIFALSIFFTNANLHAQIAIKKVRMGIQSSNIGFLPFHVAYHKGFYREQGIDLETIFMSTQAVNAAFVRGDIDYSAAVNGIVQTIVRGNPAKILACAVDRPLMSLVAKKEIRGPQDLKGRKIGGSTPGGTATLMADTALRHLRLEPGRDVVVIPLRGNRLTALESGAVDAALLGVPDNIIALDKGYNEILFVGDVVNFPQNGFGAAVKKIQDSPDEVYGMVKATYRGLLFSLDPRNREEVLNIIIKQWKLNDRRLANEMLKQLGRGVAREMTAKPEGMQLMIDLVREDSKVSQPFTVSQIVDYSFLDRARRDLGVNRQ